MVLLVVVVTRTSVGRKRSRTLSPTSHSHIFDVRLLLHGFLSSVSVGLRDRGTQSLLGYRGEGSGLGFMSLISLSVSQTP